ncbi:ABC transporter ATP-binding protein [Alcaligenaceae bacterium CGII-47]|nr:ABC transporter ATP-binding protein [Alcaligenaceae bacterium CGII-47]
MSTILEIKDLHVAYGRIEAVRGVSLSLEVGQIISVIGPNGAGKTTLLGATMGLLPSHGVLRFDGEDLYTMDVEARVEHGMCLVPEQRELFGELTVLDNLQLGAYSKRLRRDVMKSRLQSVYDRFPRLAERRSQRADTLSGGERQMLAVGRALMSAPRLLMLDEPSLGLAPLIVREILSIVRALREEGVSILLVEQNARAALESSDRGYVLEIGKIALSGDSQALANDPRVQHTYLGGGTNESL